MNNEYQKDIRRTGIAQFLSELFASFLHLVLLWVIGVFRLSTLADSKRHVSIVCRRGRRNSSLLIHNVHIASREDTLLASPLVATTPPCLSLASYPYHGKGEYRTVVIHVLGNLDAILRLQGQVTRIGRCVCVHGRGETEDRRDLGIGWRGLRGLACVLIMRVGFLTHRRIGHL